jgi:hypothetical protein
MRNVPSYKTKYIEFQEGTRDQLRLFHQYATDMLGRIWWSRTWVFEGNRSFTRRGDHDTQVLDLLENNAGCLWRAFRSIS